VRKVYLYTRDEVDRWIRKIERETTAAEFAAWVERETDRGDAMSGRIWTERPHAKIIVDYIWETKRCNIGRIPDLGKRRPFFACSIC
jgi:hypothetical protein